MYVAPTLTSEFGFNPRPLDSPEPLSQSHQQVTPKGVARRTRKRAQAERCVPSSLLVPSGGTRWGWGRRWVGSHAQQPDGPVFRVEPDRRPAFAHGSADGRVVAFFHDLQTRPGKIAFHFTVTGGRVDLEIACGGEAQFDLALFQVDLDGMGWRSGGPVPRPRSYP